jgi:hypothetical protein
MWRAYSTPGIPGVLLLSGVGPTWSNGEYTGIDTQTVRPYNGDMCCCSAD